MKLPSLKEAAEAIGALTGHADTVKSAEQLVDIIVGLFDGKPKDQDELKAAYLAAQGRTDQALDDLDDAIDKAEGKS